jgi:hypothetical protein
MLKTVHKAFKREKIPQDLYLEISKFLDPVDYLKEIYLVLLFFPSHVIKEKSKFLDPADYLII